MRLCRPLTAALLTASALAFAVPTALAQVSVDPAQSQQSLQDQLDQSAAGAADGVTSTTPAASETAPPASTPADPAAALPPASTTTGPAAGTPVTPQSSTPVPPVYLVPGPDAASQPISNVVGLTEPDAPLEPVRIAALIAAALAVLLVFAALILRNFGLQPVAEPVEVAPRGRFSKLRERPAMFADDLRDFLRRDR